MPSNIRNNKTTLLSYIEDKTNKKNSRMEREIPKPSREINITKICNNNTSFLCNVIFLIPKKICNNIDKKQRGF